MIGWLLNLARFGQEVPPGELTMRMVCVAAMAVGVVLVAASPWEGLATAGRFAATTAAFAFVMTTWSWSRRRSG